jgi:hypothetical protein
MTRAPKILPAAAWIQTERSGSVPGQRLDINGARLASAAAEPEHPGAAAEGGTADDRLKDRAIRTAYRDPATTHRSPRRARQNQLAGRRRVGQRSNLQASAQPRSVAQPVCRSQDYECPRTARHRSRNRSRDPTHCNAAHDGAGRVRLGRHVLVNAQPERRSPWQPRRRRAVRPYSVCMVLPQVVEPTQRSAHREKGVSTSPASACLRSTTVASARVAVNHARSRGSAMNRLI